MSWLSNFTSENAAALLKQAVSTVESKLDQVLDFPAEPGSGGHNKPTSSQPNRKNVGSQQRNGPRMQQGSPSRKPTARSTGSVAKEETIATSLQESATTAALPSAIPSDPGLTEVDVAEPIANSTATASHPLVPAELRASDNEHTVEQSVAASHLEPLALTLDSVEEDGEASTAGAVPIESEGIPDGAEEINADPNVPSHEEVSSDGDEASGNGVTILSRDEDGSTASRGDSASSQRNSLSEAPTANGAPDAVALLKDALDQREQQLMKCMHDNASLTDTVTTLQGQLESMEASQSSALEKIAELERQLSHVRPATTDTGAPVSADDVMRRLEEKEQIILQLRAEGESLSKKELKANTIIKRLRAEKVDVEKQLKDTTAKLDTIMTEASALRKSASEYADAERRHQKQTRELSRHQTELASAREQQKATQMSLDRCQRELNDLRRAQSKLTADAQSEALEKEAQRAREMEAKIATVEKEYAEMKASLRGEIDDLQLKLTRKQDEALWREDDLTAEINSLQQKLREAKSRADQISLAQTEATKPLLRQLEALQAQHAARQQTWEQVEKTLVAQLTELRNERDQLLHSQREHEERLSQLTSTIRGLQNDIAQDATQKGVLREQLDGAQREVVALRQECSGLRSKILELEADQQRAAEDSAALHDRLKRELEIERRARSEEQHLASNPVREEPSNAPLQPLQIEIPDAEVPLPIIEAARPPVTPRRMGSTSSAAELRLVESSVAGGAASLSTAALIDRLQASVRLYEGQVSSLQVQLQMAEQGRDELSEELVRLTAENEKLNQMAETVRINEREKTELERRYLAALELLGEKAERVEELQADINDMKDMFKAQVTDLLAQIDSLRKQGPR